MHIWKFLENFFFFFFGKVAPQPSPPTTTSHKLKQQGTKNMAVERQKGAFLIDCK